MIVAVKRVIEEQALYKDIDASNVVYYASNTYILASNENNSFYLNIDASTEVYNASETNILASNTKNRTVYIKANKLKNVKRL